MTQYLQNTIDILFDSIRSIDNQEFERLLNACNATLSNGHKIIVSGLGKNVPVCEKFVGSMLSMGMESNFMHTNSAVHGDLGMVKKGDLVIILTKSGTTVESVYLYEQLKMRGCEIWLLSFNRTSELYNRIPNHLIVELAHEGDLWNILPNHSTTMNLIVLQALAMELARIRNVRLEDFKPNHPGGAIGKALDSN